VCREEEALFRRADHVGIAASGGRGARRRRVPAVGISEQTFYRWKKVYGSMLPGEARELKQLRDENTKLKRLVADLSLDKVMLQDVIQKKF
jgi:Transposase